jgi:hypothetical protein
VYMEENINDNNHVWSDEVSDTMVQEPTTVVETPIETAEPIVETQTDVVAEVETPIETEEPKVEVTERVVEKIIEKYPEFESDDAKALFEAFQKGDEESLYNFLSEKRKDYNVLSDYDVVKEGLAKSNPKWTDKDIELELKSKYGTFGKKKDLSEIDADVYPEEYEKALEYNNKIEEREILLARDARDFRISLEEQKKNIQLPKIEGQVPAQNELTPEQIAEITKQWEDNVESVMPELTELSLKVNGEEVKYAIPDSERAELTSEMKSFDAVTYLTERGWFDKEGNANVKNIAKDVYWFKNLDKITSSIATKTKNATTKEVVSAIKNVDLSRNGVSPDIQRVDPATAVWGY